MTDQRIKKVAWYRSKLNRPLYTTLIAIVISTNLFVVVDTAITNRTTKQVNKQISELNKKQEEVILESEELSEQLREVLNRHR